MTYQVRLNGRYLQQLRDEVPGLQGMIERFESARFPNTVSAPKHIHAAPETILSWVEKAKQHWGTPKSNLEYNGPAGTDSNAQTHFCATYLTVAAELVYYTRSAVTCNKFLDITGIWDTRFEYAVNELLTTIKSITKTLITPSRKVRTLDKVRGDDRRGYQLRGRLGAFKYAEHLSNMARLITKPDSTHSYVHEDAAEWFQFSGSDVLRNMANALIERAKELEAQAELLRTKSPDECKFYGY